MKKIFTLFAALTITMAVSAQVKVGLKGGLSFANGKYSQGTYSETLSSLTRANVGLTLDFPTSSSLVIQSGLMFNGMGGKYADDDYSFKQTLNLLSIPVLAKVKLGSGFFGYAGPQLAITLSAKYKDDDGTEDIKNQTKGTSLFGLFGLGYNLNDKFYFYADYAAGLTDLAKVSSGGSKTTANAFSIGVGIGLN